MANMVKYVSYDNLSLIISKLRTVFSNINHTHTTSDIENLQDTLDIMQNNVDTLEQSVSDLEIKTQYNIMPITQDEYDALGTKDQNTLYVIEV